MSGRRAQVWWALLGLSVLVSLGLYAVIDYGAPLDLVRMRVLGGLGLGVTADLVLAVLSLLVLRTNRLRGAVKLLGVAVLCDVVLFGLVSLAFGLV